MNFQGWQLALATMVLVLGPGGAAAVAVKLSLNGARKDIADIKRAVENLTGKQTDSEVGLARLDERVKHLEGP